MPKVAYIDWSPQDSTLAVVRAAIDIIDEYSAQGYSLTLRQLYYQFVARGLLPNRQKEYKRLGDIISNARLGGFIDWVDMEDRTRSLDRLSSWSNPASILRSAAKGYRTDRWSEQPNYVEVWIEKEALAGVFQRVCEDLEVPFFSCRGYTSQSAMWEAAQRLIDAEARGQSTYILHFGDHDPSGMDMTRDIEDRMKLFGSDVEVDRLALNMDQVRQHNPPPNPAKLTDSRAGSYLSQFGRQSWELDALNPSTLAGLVRSAVLDLRDDDVWDASVERDERDAETIRLIASRFHEVSEFVRGDR